MCLKLFASVYILTEDSSQLAVLGPGEADPQLVLEQELEHPTAHLRDR